MAGILLPRGGPPTSLRCRGYLPGNLTTHVIADPCSSRLFYLGALSLTSRRHPTLYSPRSLQHGGSPLVFRPRRPPRILSQPPWSLVRGWLHCFSAKQEDKLPGVRGAGTLLKVAFPKPNAQRPWGTTRPQPRPCPGLPQEPVGPADEQCDAAVTSLAGSPGFSVIGSSDS